jgi:hypothetical protein
MKKIRKRDNYLTMLRICLIMLICETFLINIYLYSFPNKEFNYKISFTFNKSPVAFYINNNYIWVESINSIERKLDTVFIQKLTVEETNKFICFLKKSKINKMKNRYFNKMIHIHTCSSDLIIEVNGNKKVIEIYCCYVKEFAQLLKLYNTIIKNEIFIISEYEGYKKYPGSKNCR